MSWSQNFMSQIIQPFQVYLKEGPPFTPSSPKLSTAIIMEELNEMTKQANNRLLLSLMKRCLS